ncbi:MAG: hypothetical protein HYX24_06400 [Candidatus Aenigmarchaeota archaeon]|nr:hypothetical protein [Candidatus Aenigmarchaeota archaeon]
MKTMAIAVLAILLISAGAFAQLGEQRQLPKPVIKTIGVMGQGLAVSQQSASDFERVQIAIVRVAVSLADDSKAVETGILKIGGETYRLRNVSISNASATADLYRNGTQVGTLSVAATVRSEHEVWFGSLEISGKLYNLYILGIERKVKPLEKAENIREECKENPEKCKEIAKGIGNICDNEGSENCRDKIKEYCEKNPEDNRCVAVFRDYCVTHTDDERCRNHLRDFCKDNPGDEKCKGFCKEHPLVCVKAETKEAAEAVKEARQEVKEAAKIRQEVMKKQREEMQKRMEKVKERAKQQRRVVGEGINPPVVEPAATVSGTVQGGAGANATVIATIDTGLGG